MESLANKDKDEQTKVQKKNILKSNHKIHRQKNGQTEKNKKGSAIWQQKSLIYKDGMVKDGKNQEMYSVF